MRNFIRRILGLDIPQIGTANIWFKIEPEVRVQWIIWIPFEDNGYNLPKMKLVSDPDRKEFCQCMTEKEAMACVLKMIKHKQLEIEPGLRGCFLMPMFVYKKLKFKTLQVVTEVQTPSFD